MNWPHSPESQVLLLTAPCLAPPSDEDGEDHYDSATLGDFVLTIAKHRLLKTKFANSFRQFRGSLVEFEFSSLSE